MGMEHWWNDTDRGQQKCWEKTLTQFCFYYSRMVVPSTMRPVGSGKAGDSETLP